jgi:hypothetical protein
VVVKVTEQRLGYTFASIMVDKIDLHLTNITILIYLVSKNFGHYTNLKIIPMSKSKNTITAKSNQELITTNQLDTICEKLVNGLTLVEILEDKQYQFSLMKFYAYLKKNPEIEEKVTEARKYGVQTLVDKMLRIYDTNQVPDNSLILFLRDKQSFLKWIAGKITDIYSDNKVQQVKQDTNITYSWQSDDVDIKTIEAEIEQTNTTSISKD